MILNLFIIAALQASTPETYRCDVISEQRGRHITAPPIYIQIQCPPDAPEQDTLRSHLDHVLSGLRYHFVYSRGYHTRTSVNLEYSAEEGWSVAENQILVSKSPRHLTNMLYGGWGYGCAYAVNPSRAGNIESPRIHCIVSGETTHRSMRFAERSTLSALEETLWLPADDGQCSQHYLYTNVTSDMTVDGIRLETLLSQVDLCSANE